MYLNWCKIISRAGRHRFLTRALTGLHRLVGEYVDHMNRSGAQLTCHVRHLCQNIQKSLTHKIVMSTSDVNAIFECCEVTQAGSKITSAQNKKLIELVETRLRWLLSFLFRLLCCAPRVWRVGSHSPNYCGDPKDHHTLAHEVPDELSTLLSFCLVSTLGNCIWVDLFCNTRS